MVFKIQTGNGNSKISTTGNDYTINTGNGNNTIKTMGDNYSISTGDGNNKITSIGNNYGIKTGNGDQEIVFVGNNYDVKTGDGNSIIQFWGDDINIKTGNGNQQIETLDFVLDRGERQELAPFVERTAAVTRTRENEIISSILNGRKVTTTTKYDEKQTITYAGRKNINVSTGDGDSVINLTAQSGEVTTGDGDQNINVRDSFETTKTVSKTETKEEFDMRNNSIWGDPHYYLDSNNIKFDHIGQAGQTYNLFSGDNLQVQGTYAKAGNMTIVSSTNIKAGNDSFGFDAKGQLSINGAAQKDGTYTLADGTKITKAGTNMTVTPNDGTGAVVFTSFGSNINIEANGYFSNPGGIVGNSVVQGRVLTEAQASRYTGTIW